MSSVREACCKFLMRQLHPTNCLGIRNFADTHSCKELHKRSHKFALENFQEVMNTEEFLLLPFSEVFFLLFLLEQWSTLFLYKERRMFFKIYLSNFYSTLMVFLQSIWSINSLYIFGTIYINDHSFHFIVKVEVLISSGQLNIEKEEIVFQVLIPSNQLPLWSNLGNFEII